MLVDSHFAYSGYKVTLDSIYTFRTDTATAVYNLEADCNHNYNVSAGGVLVHNCETGYLTFFHKGELNGGIISATRSLSTGIDKSLVEGLTISGRVWEF